MKRNDGFKWQPFSKKQMQILSWWDTYSPVKDCDGIIADGAVRSGKTVAMCWGFFLWAMANYNGHNFALCGKTVGSLKRNVISPLKQMLISAGYVICKNESTFKNTVCAVREIRAENLLVVKKADVINYFYFFGGKDESSQDLIQGITLAGVLFDEVALMPENFVTQAEARCSVEGAKFWYNCNPKHPKHFFKQCYIDVAEKKGLFYLHFLMDDNLTLSEKTKERFKRMFSGVFYQRNILGLWVNAEGRIYTAFDKHNIIDRAEWYAQKDGKYTNDIRNRISIVNMGVDFGGNMSSHAFNCTAITNGFREVITVKECRIVEKDKGLTPEELEQHFVGFVKECLAEYPQLRVIYCDSAEQVLIRGFRKALRDNHINVAVKNAKKMPILERIRFYGSIQSQARYYVVSDCKHTIEAFENALWDDKKVDTRLDDGSTNIDSLDAQEYSTERYQNAIIEARAK